MWLTFPSHFLIDQCVIKKKRIIRVLLLKVLCLFIKRRINNKRKLLV